jgi:hypothetical protein
MSSLLDDVRQVGQQMDFCGPIVIECVVQLNISGRAVLVPPRGASPHGYERSSISAVVADSASIAKVLWASGGSLAVATCFEQASANKPHNRGVGSIVL